MRKYEMCDCPQAERERADKCLSHETCLKLRKDGVCQVLRLRDHPLPRKYPSR